MSFQFSELVKLTNKANKICTIINKIIAVRYISLKVINMIANISNIKSVSTILINIACFLDITALLIGIIPDLFPNAQSHGLSF